MFTAAGFPPQPLPPNYAPPKITDPDPHAHMPPSPLTTIPLGDDCVFHLYLQNDHPACPDGFLIGIVCCFCSSEYATVEALCIPRQTRSFATPP